MSDSESSFIEIPWDALPADTLNALVEEFVTREGTDYGEQEVTLERKVMQVINGIKRKEYVIVFASEQESTHILTRQQFLQWQSAE